MEYSRRYTKNIPNENQSKILNKIYQIYLVSTTQTMKLVSVVHILWIRDVSHYDTKDKFA